MIKLLNFLGLALASDIDKLVDEGLRLTQDGIRILNENADLRRKLELQAEQHKKIEEIKIAQVNLAISSENDRLKTQLARVTKELNELQDRYHVAKLELQNAQSDIDLKAENAELRQRMVELEAHHRKTEAGVKTLVTFIHRSHRLHLPFVDNTIRGAIQKAMNNGG